MISKLVLTVLIDNTTDRTGLLNEHGLSIWIEADDRRILFDTGQSDILFHNADVLGIDLRTADSLALSHGHYDHTGGVAPLLAANPSIKAFCHPGIFIPRYSRQSDGSMRPIGISSRSSDALHRISDSVNWITAAKWLTDDICITGPIPRETAFEDTGGDFYLDPDGKKRDPVEDDSSMLFRTQKGICVVTGCCHSGLVNTLRHIRTLAGNDAFHTIAGGFHLLHASPERIEKTFDFLESIRMKQIVPCHCTGKGAVEGLKQRFGTKIVHNGAGTRLGIF